MRGVSRGRLAIVADTMVDRGLAWIEREGHPFFLLIHVFDPHMNYDPPEVVAGHFTSRLGRENRAELPVHSTPLVREYASTFGPGARAFIAAAYEEEILFVDRELGRGC